MDQAITKNASPSKRGQTALVLILLSAAALIFLAITLNWGRIAQYKSTVTIAADQAVSLYGSLSASYGEQLKNTYLNNQNMSSSPNWQIFLAVLALVIAIVIAIVTWGAATPLAVALFHIILIMAIAMAAVSLTLQVAVIQPGIAKLWNRMMENQPAKNQFFEQVAGTGLLAAVGDQALLTDYFDMNTNGIFGMDAANKVAKDTVNRFAFFYSERLKMMVVHTPPQLKYFYDQLDDLVNGATCEQNFIDSQTTDGRTSNTGIGIYESCKDPNTMTGHDPTTMIDYCGTDWTMPDESNPLCTGRIPYEYNLNDACTDSNPSDMLNYNPYCDPCCQPMRNGTLSLRPTYCYPYTDPANPYPTSCYSKPDGPGCSSDPINAGRAAPTQCSLNNPFGPDHPLIYDPGFQEFANGTSILDKLGRDQQQAPFDPMKPEYLGDKSNNVFFPNGVFPFFWYMDAYAPLLSDLNYNAGTWSPTVSLTSPAQAHWCVAGGSVPVAQTPAEVFPALTQLGQGDYKLPYSCQGPACCTNYLMDTLPGSGGGASAAIVITVGPSSTLTVTPQTADAGTDVTVNGQASDADGFTISTINVFMDGAGVAYQDITSSLTLGGLGAANASVTGKYTIPVCSSGSSPQPLSGIYTFTMVATDANGNSWNTQTSITVNNTGSCSAPPPPPPPPAQTG